MKIQWVHLLLNLRKKPSSCLFKLQTLNPAKGRATDMGALIALRTSHMHTQKCPRTTACIGSSAGFDLYILVATEASFYIDHLPVKCGT